MTTPILCMICGTTIDINKNFSVASWGLAHTACSPHWLSRDEQISAKLESPDPNSTLLRGADGRWYFCDDAGVYGPFMTSDAALMALEDYAENL